MRPFLVLFQFSAYFQKINVSEYLAPLLRIVWRGDGRHWLVDVVAADTNIGMIAFNNESDGVEPKEKQGGAT
jgi:hypothetical protein